MEVLQVQFLVPVEGVDCEKFTAEGYSMMKTMAMSNNINFFLSCSVELRA
jgi:hypothetical protein